jgi:hypothetical protein
VKEGEENVDVELYLIVLKSSEEAGSFQLHFSFPTQSPCLFRAGRSRGGFLILFAFSSQEASVNLKFCCFLSCWRKTGSRRGPGRISPGEEVQEKGCF